MRSNNDWEDQNNEIDSDLNIIFQFNAFTNLEDDSGEAYIQANFHSLIWRMILIQAKFSALVTSLGIILKVACTPQTETKIIVGGMRI